MVRRALVLLMAVFLVNLPFVHETFTHRQLEQSGRVVAATVLDAQHAGNSYLVDYRLPRSVDPAQKRFSARVDRASYERARETRAIAVEVVPGKPGTNRPVGEVSNNLFAVVAAIGDLVLLLVGLMAYRRRRLRSRHVVSAVEGGEVTMESARGSVAVVGPDGWAERLRPGQRVRGRLHLVTDQEVVPCAEAAGGLEQVRGASYVVRGRVVDARAGEVVLELADRTRLAVQTGSHRIRADVRDVTEVRGTLCFTPARV
jgi:hypothetical protein